MSDGGWSPETQTGRGDSGTRVDLASVVSVDPHTGFETEPRRATGSDGVDDRDRGSGGYPLDQLFEEVAFIAYHFGWSHDDVLALPHWERRRWCEEISAINERMNERSE